MGTTVIAEHTPFAVVFQTTDPVTGSVMQPNMSGEIPPYDVGRVELGALGTVVPTQEPDNLEPHSYRKGGHIGNSEYGCRVDGIMQDGPGVCTSRLSTGIAVPDKRHD